MAQLEIGGEFSFEFYYISADEKELCSLTGAITLGEYPSVEAIQKVKADCDAQVAEKNDGFAPVTPGQMASIAVRRLTGEDSKVEGIDPEWAEPLSGGFLDEISERVFEEPLEDAE